MMDDINKISQRSWDERFLVFEARWVRACT
jgi:hypothetical protein